MISPHISVLSQFLLCFNIVTVAADYSRWSDLPSCAQSCFAFGVDNTIGNCSNSIACVCGSDQPALASLVNTCLLSSPPCDADPAHTDALSYGSAVFCNVSDEESVTYELIEDSDTLSLALFTQDGGLTSFSAQISSTAGVETSESTAAASSSATSQSQSESGADSTNSPTAAASTTSGDDGDGVQGTPNTSTQVSGSSSVPPTSASSPDPSGGPSTSYSIIVVTLNTSSATSAGGIGTATTVVVSASALTTTVSSSSRSGSVRRSFGGNQDSKTCNRASYFWTLGTRIFILHASIWVIKWVV